MSLAVTMERDANGCILGLSGELSGIYEILIKQGSVLNKISVGELESLNKQVFPAEGVVKEFDAVNNNSIFEFKFRLTLRKLYQQVIAGIDSASMPHLKVLTDYPQFNKIRNLVYFGESDLGYVSSAIIEFIKNRPDIASKVILTKKGLAVKLSLPEVKEFLLSEATLSLFKLEHKKFKNKSGNNNFLWQLHSAEDIINRKISQLGKEKFDVIIACSNIPFNLLNKIRDLKFKMESKKKVNISFLLNVFKLQAERSNIRYGYDFPLLAKTSEVRLVSIKSLMELYDRRFRFDSREAKIINTIAEDMSKGIVKNTDDKAIVVHLKKDGNMFLHDGRHRLEALALLGIDYVYAHVIHIDASRDNGGFLEAPRALIKDVERIDLPAGMNIQRRQDIELIVEGPLVKACQELFDKGVVTVNSSANSINIGIGAFIKIDRSALSPENLLIANRICQGIDEDELEILVDEDTSRGG